MRVCWKCQGEGGYEVMGYSINPYSGTSCPDPQCSEDILCEVCEGQREIKDGVTLKEVRALEPGQIYDITLFGRSHELGHKIPSGRGIFRMRYEHYTIELISLMSRDQTTRSGKMRHPVVHLIAGEAIIDDVPESIESFPELTDPMQRTSLRYSFTDAFIKSIDTPVCS